MSMPPAASVRLLFLLIICIHGCFPHKEHINFELNTLNVIFIWWTEIKSKLVVVGYVYVHPILMSL
uniref:Uncharacterized protein n=1 Tax=Rhizophora mucronata TaxID=61149 RepID=A0A2P2M266_RHIMU